MFLDGTVWILITESFAFENGETLLNYSASLIKNSLCEWQTLDWKNPHKLHAHIRLYL